MPFRIFVTLGLKESESGHFDFLCSTDREANKSLDVNVVCQHNWLWSCLFSVFWHRSHFFLDFHLQNQLKNMSLLKYRNIF